MAKDKQPRDFLKRGTTHNIDEAAQRIFRSLLPTFWIVNPLREDYGKDYHIEITCKDTEKVTGGAFYVQLKGADGAVYRHGGSFVTHQMTLRHLSYYCHEVKVPVFLVVVDIKTNMAYWLFLQEYLNERKDWQKKRKHTLHIPISNELADFSTFEAKANEAIKYMRSISVSTRDRVDFEIERLEAKDPRFKVYPIITRGSAHYRFEPVQNVDIQVHFKGNDPTLAARVNALINKGETIRFAPGEVEFEGSILFEEFNEVGGAIRVSSELPATTRLTCLDKDHNMISQPLEITGIIEGGRTEQHFRSNQPNAPYTLEFGPIAQGKGKVHFHADPTVWQGQPLLMASYFEPTLAFFEALVQHGRLGFDCQWQGNPILSGTGTMGELRGFGDFVYIMGIMNKARKIARHFGINPIFTGHNVFDDEPLRQVETLYDIVFEGRHECEPRNDFNLTMRLLEMSKKSDLIEGPHKLELYTSEEFCLPFMEEQILVGRLAIEVPSAIIAMSSHELTERLASTDELVQLRYTCSEGTGWSIRQLTDAEKETLKDDD